MNDVKLLGRLAKDPVLKDLSNGKKVCYFTVACSRVPFKRDSKAGTDFVPCVAYSPVADIIGGKLKKGERILVSSGSWRNVNYVKDNKAIYLNYCLVTGFEFVGMSSQTMFQHLFGERKYEHSFYPFDELDGNFDDSFLADDIDTIMKVPSVED